VGWQRAGALYLPGRSKFGEPRTSGCEEERDATACELFKQVFCHCYNPSGMPELLGSPGVCLVVEPQCGS